MPLYSSPFQRHRKTHAVHRVRFFYAHPLWVGENGSALFLSRDLDVRPPTCNFSVVQRLDALMSSISQAIPPALFSDHFIGLIGGGTARVQTPPLPGKALAFFLAFISFSGQVFRQLAQP